MIRTSLLALVDLIHNWVVSLCLVFTLAAALSPVLILKGLKHGFVQSMVDDLSNDPLIRQVSPVNLLSVSKSPEWFQELESRTDVETAIPIYTTMIGLEDEHGTIRIDSVEMEISHPQDPLLIHNNCSAPSSPDEIVLSEPMAKALKAKQGDHLTLRVMRRAGSGAEVAATPVVVAGVAPARTRGKQVVWAAMQLVEEIEAYKSGEQVARVRWAGDRTGTKVRFPAAVTVSKQEIPASNEIISGTGFRKRLKVPVSEFNQRTGANLPSGIHIERWETDVAGMRISDFETLAARLLEKGIVPVILPWPEVSLPQIRDTSGKQWQVFVGDHEVLKALRDDDFESAMRLSKSLAEAEPAGGFHAAWTSGSRNAMEPTRFSIEWLLEYFREILAEENAAEPVQFLFEHAGRSTRLPFALKEEPGIAPDAILVSSIQYAQVSLVLDGTVRVDAKTGALLSRSLRFHNFRCYARSLSTIESLVEFLIQNLSIKTDGIRSRLWEVERIQALDRDLSNLFKLIAMATGMAACLGFTASVYASVQRNRRSVAQLRLMGLRAFHLMIFPVVQGLVLSALAVGVAASIFYQFKKALMFFFSGELKKNELCRLPDGEILTTLAVSCSLALLVTLVAGLLLTRLDPALHLREE
jgi:putative ABC transport system permease protein